jgi:ATP-dependent protease ClpP protease subunit
MHYRLGPVEPSTKIADLLTMLRMGKVSDTIIISIDSPGGSVSVMNKIITEMQNTDAEVICKTGWVVASAAAIIALDECLNYHTLEVNPFTVFIIHYPFSCKDRDCNVRIPVAGEARKQVRQYYSQNMPFLTKQEQDDMFVRNEDVYIMGKDLLKRLSKKH